MDFDVRPCVSAEEVKEAIAPIAYYFGRSAPDENLAERLTRVLPAQRVYAAWESGRAVGGLGAFPFQLTVPGGRVPAAGVTIAGDRQLKWKGAQAADSATALPCRVDALGR